MRRRRKTQKYVVRFLSLLQAGVLFSLLIIFGVTFRGILETYLPERSCTLGVSAIGLSIGLQFVVVLGRWRAFHE